MNTAFILSFFILMLVGAPLWVAMALPSIIIVLWSDIPVALVVQRAFVSVDSFILLAVPLFMLAGKLMNVGGITRRILDFAMSLVGHFRGGLAQVNIVASMLFAGISGSAVADVAGIGTILIPEMVRRRYEAGFSVAVTAASSMVGPIIPPSIPFIIAGALGGVSVGRLFVGGIVPGLLLGFLLMMITYFISRVKNHPVEPKAAFRDSVRTLRASFLAVIMPVIIVGGIVTGVATPTEVAVLAVLYALVIGRWVYRDLSWADVLGAITGVAREVGVILSLVAFASVYSYVLTLLRIPQNLVAALVSISDNPTVVMLAVNGVLLILGCFITTTPALILTVPVLMPVAHQVGIDPVYFLVVVCFNLTLAMITPPVGIALFIASKIGGVPVARASAALVPYYLVMLTVLLALTFVPGLSTWLPRLLS